MSEVLCDGSILLDKRVLDESKMLFDKLYVSDYVLIKSALPKLPDRFNLSLLNTVETLLPKHVQNALVEGILLHIRDRSTPELARNSIELWEFLLKKQLESRDKFSEIDIKTGELLITNKRTYLKMVNHEILKEAVCHIIPLLTRDHTQLEIIKEFRLNLFLLKQFLIPVPEYKNYFDIMKQIRTCIREIYRIYWQFYPHKDRFKKEICYALPTIRTDKGEKQLLLYGLENSALISLIWFIGP